MAKHLLTPVKLGAIAAKNRVFMAPLTRSRAVQGNVPNPLAITYYEQRASAGLIVAEATQVSALGQGYVSTPGISTEAQIEGWKKVTGAVHDKGGKIVLQLWHVGRLSHTKFHPAEGLPLAPSAIAPHTGKVMLPDFSMGDWETPRAATQDDIKAVVEQFHVGARNALAAGFDGVEIHGANGYLIEQFLEDGTNKRTDAYGGSLENRARLLFEVLDAVKAVVPADRVGLRLSPMNKFGDASDSDPVALYSHVVGRLNPYKLAYLHLVRPGVNMAGGPNAPETITATLRKMFTGALITNGGYTLADADKAVADKATDAVAFGRWFISNPDLPRRAALGAALNPFDFKTFYGGNHVGYTDYPFLKE